MARRKEVVVTIPAAVGLIISAYEISIHLLSAPFIGLTWRPTFLWTSGLIFCLSVLKRCNVHEVVKYIIIGEVAAAIGINVLVAICQGSRLLYHAARSYALNHTHLGTLRAGFFAVCITLLALVVAFALVATTLELVGLAAKRRVKSRRFKAS